MEHGGNIALERAIEQQIEKILLVQVIGDLAVHQILELVGLFHVVHRDDVGDAAVVQALDDDWRR